MINPIKKMPIISMKIDDSFNMGHLKGLRVEQSFGIKWRSHPGQAFHALEGIEIDAGIIKLEGIETWQLFYLDAGLGFWEDLAIANYEDYVNGGELVSLSQLWPINGLRVLDCGCVGSIDDGRRCFIYIDFESGRIVFKYDEAADCSFVCFENR